jgi:glutathione S-transferase
MLKLYYGPHSCALAADIALAESGLDYEAVAVDLRAWEQREPEFLALNPKGRVPTLVTDHGVLTENAAILAFVAQSAPQAGLAPLNDPFAFAQVQAFNAYLASTVHVAFAHGRRGYRWADDPAAIAEMKRKAPEVVTDCFKLIEGQMLKGPWVTGDAYSVCDAYLFTFTRWLAGAEIDPTRFPKTQEHARRMADRPAVGKVLPRYAS